MSDLTIAREAFGVTPDTRFLFMCNSHREALASVVHGIECGRPFMVLTGKPGTGKTTLLFRLLQHYRDSARTVFIFQTQCNPRELLRYLLSDCGVEFDRNDVVSMHGRFNDLLVQTHSSGKRFLLFLDEAHNLTEETLEAVRLLSDFEIPDKKLVQIIFAGQPRLDEVLKRASMVQLRQRIPIFCRLEPLTKEETFSYVAHRLRLVGATPDVFTPVSKEMIYDLTSGLPRDIHNLCFGALCLACAMGSPEVDYAMVAEAAEDLGWGRPEGNHERPAKAYAAGAAAAPAPIPNERIVSRPVPTSTRVATDVSNATGFQSEPVQDPKEAAKEKAALSAHGEADPDRIRDLLLGPAGSGARPRLKQVSPSAGVSRKKRGLGISVAACCGLLIALAMLDPSRRLIGSSGDAINASAPRPTVPQREVDRREAGTQKKGPLGQSGATSRQDAQNAVAVDAPWISSIRLGSAFQVAVKSDPEPAQPLSRVGDTANQQGFKLGETITTPTPVLGRQAEVRVSKLIVSPQPRYPAAARARGITGVVELSAVIDKSGRLKDIRVVSGNDLLTGPAVEAARLQRYSPYLFNSQPLEVPTRIRFVFH